MCGISAAKTTDGKAAILCAKIASNQVARGSQGTGLAWRLGQDVHIFKRPIGPNTFLKDNEPKIETLGANESLGHNRWPSHGAVRQQNTHPFLSCDGTFALVHNGSAPIPHGIWGFLEKRGHKIQGDTDSEMFMHTIEELLKANQGDRTLALRAFNKLAKGFSILLIFTDGEIWGTRDNWPCVILMKPGTTLIASEEGGFRDIVGEKEVVKLFKPGKHTIYRLDGTGMTFWGDYEKLERPIEYQTLTQYVYNPLAPDCQLDFPRQRAMYDPVWRYAAERVREAKDSRPMVVKDLELLERANGLLPPGDQLRLGSKKERKKLRKLIKNNLWLREALDDETEEGLFGKENRGNWD